MSSGGFEDPKSLKELKMCFCGVEDPKSLFMLFMMELRISGGSGAEDLTKEKLRDFIFFC